MHYVFLNYVCNVRCPFCFNPPTPSREELVGPPLRRVAEELYRGRTLGFDGVNFLGGEVTLRKDLVEIVLLARKTGYRFLQMDTNGLHFADEAYCRRVVRAGMQTVRISVHGHNAQLHDSQVRSRGAFDKVLTAIKNLRRTGATVGLNFVINAKNVLSLPEFVRFFIDSVGIRNFSISHLRFVGHMGLPENQRALKLSMTEAAPLVRSAFQDLRTRGCTDNVSLGEFVPCVLPELAEYMTDWSSDHLDDCISNPDGSSGDAGEICHSSKTRIKACGSCRFGSRCLGVEKEYLKLFGETEFKSVPGP